MFNNKKTLFFEIVTLLIISIPSFFSLLNPYYFVIHDNQHPVRLYLLDQAIKQGYFYPRWVDKLTFGFGDPLFNFYPPLVYYLGEFFHLLGFSLIWSIKLVFILGFILSIIGSYLLAKKFFSSLVSFLVATIYQYLFYHAINAYVRGALADFFTMSLIPFVFLFLIEIYQRPNFKNIFLFGFFIGLTVICHQLIVLPLIFFLLFFFIFLFFLNKKRIRFFFDVFTGGLIGLGTSAFYWLPMLIEKKYTFLDKELGLYKEHFIYPYQFWYSPWGFGASVKGIEDGMSFQIGKIPLLLIFLSLISFIFYVFSRKKNYQLIKKFLIVFFLSFFGLWMTTEYSDFIWERLTFLWNLQFPWRFLSTTAIFLSLFSGFGFLFFEEKFGRLMIFKNLSKVLTLFFIFLTIFKYQQYFQPQAYLKVSDKDLITEEEIVWKQSKTVLHFVPKGVKAKKNSYGVYILDIEKDQLPKDIYKIKKGTADVKLIKNFFQEKIFEIKTKNETIFQLNTFNFPGWQAYLNNQKIKIIDDNDYKLITVFIPKGSYKLKFVFENTLIRTIGELITFITVILVFIFSIKNKSFL